MTSKRPHDWCSMLALVLVLLAVGGAAQEDTSNILSTGQITTQLPLIGNSIIFATPRRERSYAFTIVSLVLANQTTYWVGRTGLAAARGLTYREDGSAFVGVTGGLGPGTSATIGCRVTLNSTTRASCHVYTSGAQLHQITLALSSPQGGSWSCRAPPNSTTVEISYFRESYAHGITAAAGPLANVQCMNGNFQATVVNGTLVLDVIVATVSESTIHRQVVLYVIVSIVLLAITQVIVSLYTVLRDTLLEQAQQRRAEIPLGEWTPSTFL